MDQWMTEKQLADMLGISQKTLAQKRWAGSGPRFHKLGRGRMSPVRYRLDEVEAWIGKSLRSTSDNREGARS